MKENILMMEKRTSYHVKPFKVEYDSFPRATKRALSNHPEALVILMDMVSLATMSSFKGYYYKKESQIEKDLFNGARNRKKTRKGLNYLMEKEYIFSAPANGHRTFYFFDPEYAEHIFSEESMSRIGVIEITPDLEARINHYLKVITCTHLGSGFKWLTCTQLGSGTCTRSGSAEDNINQLNSVCVKATFTGKEETILEMIKAIDNYNWSERFWEWVMKKISHETNKFKGSTTRDLKRYLMNKYDTDKGRQSICWYYQDYIEIMKNSKR